MSTLETLKAARAAARRFEFHQESSWMDGEGNDIEPFSENIHMVHGVCTHGALSYAMGGGLHLDKPFMRELLVYLDFSSWCELCEWNDAPERTKEDVLARFDRAIEVAQGIET